MRPRILQPPKAVDLKDREAHPMVCGGNNHQAPCQAIRDRNQDWDGCQIVEGLQANCEPEPLRVSISGGAAAGSFHNYRQETSAGIRLWTSIATPPFSARSAMPTICAASECEFRNLCGGSRSRSFALSGDCLAEDPRCVYVPRAAGTRQTSGVESFPKAWEPLVQVQPETFR
jgi:hypothetical protein